MGNNYLSRLTLILKYEGMLFRFNVDEGIATISCMCGEGLGKKKREKRK